MVRDFKFRKKFNWRKLYLLKSELFEVFDAEKFLHDFEKRLNMHYEQDVELNLKNYVNEFLPEKGKRFLDRILKFATVLLENEFSVHAANDQKFTFKRTTYKRKPEYMLDALAAIGKQSTAEEIFAYCEQHFPGIISNVNSVASACLRNEQIITVGRT